MPFSEIPEDKEQSFPCQCGGELTLHDGEWTCNQCEACYSDAQPEKKEQPNET